jgi:hypothetical protein
MRASFATDGYGNVQGNVHVHVVVAVPVRQCSSHGNGTAHELQGARGRLC